MTIGDEEPPQRKRPKRKRPVLAWGAIGALCALAQLGIEIGKLLGSTLF